MKSGIRNSSVIVLALANASAVIGMTLITPSLPMIRYDFKLSADITQFILTFYLIFVSLGQLICGTLSDRYGRRPVLLIGSILFAVGGVLAMYAPNINMLLFFRILQAAGAAACLSMARVIVNDSYEKNEAAEKLSLLTAVMVIFPNIALILGGAIAETIGWRGSMGVIFIFGCFLFFGTLFLVPESNSQKTIKLDYKKISNSYTEVLKNKTFINFTIVSSIQTGIFFSLFSFMPYQFYRLGVSPLEFGFWLSFTGLGYFAGNMINRKYASKVGISKMCFLGCIGSLIALGVMLLCYLYGLTNPLSIALPLFMFGLGNGITVANSLIGAISSAGKNSGTATGITGAISMASGGVIGSIIISSGGDASFFIALSIIIILGIFAVYISSLIFRNDRKILIRNL